MSNAKKTGAEAETTAKKVKTDAEQMPDTVVYLGPDIKNVVFKGTVFEGGIPNALADKIKEMPALKGMLVPVSEFSAAGVEIVTQGTALNNLYNAVYKKLQENNK